MKYVCTICGYVYDEAAGGPWDLLPADWKCPLCGAAKSDFRPEKEPTMEAAGEEAEKIPVPSELYPMSSTELSILCSNLARGCEKQFLPDQAAAFQRLSQYFRSKAGEPASPSFQSVLEKINQDLEEGYPMANSISGRAGDRGALRSLVWSEKVTRILSSLLTRFSGKETQDLLQTGVYVCTICGFIYVGDTLPQVCPVCKVPSYKFERIGG